MTSFLGLLILMALQGAIACAIAQTKNRGGGEWFFLGAVLGIFAIIVLLCLPKLSDIPPGWYPNPGGQGERYWDGARWSDLPARYPTDTGKAQGL